jgi:hypothetical protein
MKLHEIRQSKKKDGNGDRTLTIDSVGDEENVKVKVEFKFTAGDTAAEDEYDITNITLMKDIYEYDDEGKKTDKVRYKKGSDATEIDGWTRKVEKKLQDQLG